ncbi:CopG family ribbon-helix-helix protein [Providencia manganoxydans]
MESRKTTTISFRIDDELKKKLSDVAKRENKTITVKAKEALTEYLEINPINGMIKNTSLEIHKTDLDITGKIQKWKGAFDTEYLGVMENQKLLNEYHQKIKQLTNEIENHQNKSNGIGFKLAYFSIGIVFFNFILTGLLFVVLGN